MTVRRRPSIRRTLAVVAVLGCALTACDSSPQTTAAPKATPSPVVQSACAKTLTSSTSGTIQSPEVDEASGIAASAKNPGTLWINNDSGDSARVFAVAPTGQVQGIYPFDGASAIDWEDIALGPGPEAKTPYLYAGDIGDNGSVRPNIVLYRVAEPKVVADGGTHQLSGVETLTLNYPDGAHDAEALMVDPRDGEIYIVIKHLALGGPAAIYHAPGNLVGGSTTVLTRVGEVKLPRVPFFGAATAADISRDGKAIGIRTYGSVRLWHLGPKQTVVAALAAKPCLGPIPLEKQGEALGFQANDRGYFTVSEGVNVPIHHFTVPTKK
jgi:hypothetical protein